jgi:hypothetical protein
MKKTIETMMSGYIYDNSSYIKESQMTVADFAILEAESMDQGWVWFLEEKETDEFYADGEKRDGLIREIKEFLKENYDFYLNK